MRPDRHAFVLLAGPPEPEVYGGSLVEVEAWRMAGLPFVVASARPDDPPDTVRLGLALLDKRRIGLRVSGQRIAAVLPPPSLDEAEDHAPAEWVPAIQAVRVGCAACGLDPFVFGSLAWTCRSGAVYLHERSDLDLLLVARRPERPEPLREAVARLLAASGDGPRLDGELRLADGGAVNLREFAAAPSEILVKAHGGASLLPWSAVAKRLEGMP